MRAFASVWSVELRTKVRKLGCLAEARMVESVCFGRARARAKNKAWRFRRAASQRTSVGTPSAVGKGVRLSEGRAILFTHILPGCDRKLGTNNKRAQVVCVEYVQSAGASAELS